jgi:glycosyltransferase involved in cell wall biosynthesis
VKLVFVSPYYPPYSVGGAEQSTLELGAALKRRAHDVKVLTLKLGDESYDGEVPVEAVDVGVRLKIGGRPLRPATFDSMRNQFRFARAVSRAARNADLVHCQTLHLLPAAYVGARHARVPIVATIRDMSGICPLAVCLLQQPRVPHDCRIVKLERTCLPQFRALYGGPSLPRHVVAALVRFATARGRSALLRRCDTVFSISSDIAHIYAEAGLLGNAKLERLPNIVSPPSFAARSAGDFAVYTGRVTQGKGMSVLLDAVESVRRAEPQFRLVVAGYAPPAWRQRLESAEGIDYRGRVGSAELRALMAAGRFAIVPSIWPEPLGRVALEASANGLAVIASRVGGLPEVVRHQETGVLVDARNPIQLADAILRLWQNPDLSQKLGAAGRKYVLARFGAAAIAERAERLYESVLAGSATIRKPAARSGRRASRR